MTYGPPLGPLLPSETTCERASQLWRRIRTRFELSSVWRAAPAELIATEFLSWLRLALAPMRVEAALYDSSRDPTLLAATLPPIVTPVAADATQMPSRLAFNTSDFFAHGGQAAREWIDHFRDEVDQFQAVARTYADYFSSFPDVPDVYSLTPDGSITLRVLASTPYARDSFERLLADAKLPSILHSRTGGAAAFHGEWQPVNRRLSDHLLHEFLDRLENDLAILADGDTPDIWVLLLDDESERLKFHAPPQKLKRLLRYYAPSRGSSAAPRVADLRRQVERDGSTAVSGDLVRHLAPCHTGFHRYLATAWSDECELTVDHLECVAEKFKGWPVDRGIAGSIVTTGCGDVVRDFATRDYRVAAYSYADRPSRIPGESDEFYRVRLAERAFIKISPHLVELPLLWGLDAEGRGRCAALLLVLFNGYHDGDEPDDYFARRALAIRAAVEPWYLVFEQHARLMERNAVMHGHIVHEVRSAFQQIDRDLSPEGRSYLQTRLELLWSAYSFVRDNRGPRRTLISIDELQRFVNSAASDVISGDGRFAFCIASAIEEAEAAGILVELGQDLVGFLLRGFLEESVADLSNLRAAGLLADARINFRLVGDSQLAPGEERVLLEIEHSVSPGVARFVKAHGAQMGRAPIFTDNRQRAHLGLFYMGVLLQGCGGEFVRPSLHETENRVTWAFAFRSQRRSGTVSTIEDSSR